MKTEGIGANFWDWYGRFWAYFWPFGHFLPTFENGFGHGKSPKFGRFLVLLAIWPLIFLFIREKINLKKYIKWAKKWPFGHEHERRHFVDEKAPRGAVVRYLVKNSEKWFLFPRGCVILNSRHNFICTRFRETTLAKGVFSLYLYLKRVEIVSQQ